MKLNEFIELINKTKPVVRFNNKVETDFETGFDTGMMARAISFNYTDPDVVKIDFEFREFEEHNKNYEKSNWYDKQGNPTLKWSQTNFYPNSKIEDIYFTVGYDLDCFEIVDDVPETEEINALRWVVEQFEKVLAGEKAGNVVECLSFANSVLKKYPTKR